MAELATTTAASVYNQVYHLQKPDYSRDVTEASKSAFVFVLLTSSQGTNTESRVLIEIWRELAKRFGDVKFCQIRADLCIEGYPDKNTPTVLVYKDGDIRKQIVTLRELGGVRTGVKGMWKTLLLMHRSLLCWSVEVVMRLVRGRRQHCSICRARLCVCYTSQGVKKNYSSKVSIPYADTFWQTSRNS
jgi:hypothetical protein